MVGGATYLNNKNKKEKEYIDKKLHSFNETFFDYLRTIDEGNLTKEIIINMEAKLNV